MVDLIRGSTCDTICYYRQNPRRCGKGGAPDSFVRHVLTSSYLVGFCTTPLDLSQSYIFLVIWTSGSKHVSVYASMLLGVGIMKLFFISKSLENIFPYILYYLGYAGRDRSLQYLFALTPIFHYTNKPTFYRPSYRSSPPSQLWCGHIEASPFQPGTRGYLGRWQSQ